MPVGINVRLETKALTRSLTRLERKHVPKASAVGLNRAAKAGIGAAAKHISKETTIQQKIVRVGIKLVRKASAATQRALIVVRGKTFNIIRFKAKQTKLGVRAKAWGKKQFYKGAFIVKNNNRTGGFVAHRTGVTKRGKAREQIDALHGPGILQEFGRKQTDAVIRKKIRERYIAEFGRDLKRRLGRL